MKKNFTLLWPERRTVDASRIKLWYFDAVANNEIEDGDDAHVLVCDMALALHRYGHITLGRHA